MPGSSVQHKIQVTYCSLVALSGHYGDGTRTVPEFRDLRVVDDEKLGLLISKRVAVHCDHKKSTGLSYVLLQSNGSKGAIMWIYADTLISTCAQTLSRLLTMLFSVGEAIIICRRPRRFVHSSQFSSGFQYASNICSLAEIVLQTDRAQKLSTIYLKHSWRQRRLGLSLSIFTR